MNDAHVSLAVDFEAPHVLPVGPLYTALDSSFYHSIRDELTGQRLHKLAVMAKRLERPIRYGVFNSDEHYSNTLQLMLRSTMETRHRGIFLNRLVLPMLAQKDRLIDVGPGDGQLSRWIGNQFNYVTLVDSNNSILNELKSTSAKPVFRRHVNVDYVSSCVLNHLPMSKTYDLALLSQVLYYLPKHEWLLAVDLLYNSLREGGALVVILSGDQFGKSELITHFGGQSPDIDSLAMECIMRYGTDSVKLYRTKEFIRTCDHLSLLHIAGLFLNDSGVYAYEKELSEYIRVCCQVASDQYLLSTQQKFILIVK